MSYSHIPGRRVSLRAAAVLALAPLLAGCRPDALWSPDGSKLALDVRGRIVTMDVGTRKFRQLTRGPLTTFNPAWSADGTRLACFRAALKQQEITSLSLVALDPTTGKETVMVPKIPLAGKKQGGAAIQMGGVLEIAQEALSIAWSPDGSKVVYTALSGEDPTVWIAGADGGNPRQLVQGKGAMRPSWSPDGNWIAYYGMSKPKQPEPAPGAEAQPAAPESDPPSLEVIQPDGSGARVVWDGRGEMMPAPFGPDPQWTPDGKNLLIVAESSKKDSGPVQDTCELWSVSVENGEHSKLGGVAGPSIFVNLAGGRAAYFTGKKEDKNPTLGILFPPAEGRSVGELVSPQQRKGGGGRTEVDTIPVPSLSPDGKWVVVPFVPKTGQPILLMQPTGGGKTQYVPMPLAAEAPAAKKPVKKPVPKAKPRRR